MPNAGLEPARVTPHAPQTCASTNSASSASLNIEGLIRLSTADSASAVPAPEHRQRAAAWRRRARRAATGVVAGAAGVVAGAETGGWCGGLHDRRTLDVALEIGDPQRRQDERHERPDRHAVQEVGRAAGAEGGHRRAAAENGEIRTLALLQQDDQDQEDTDDDVQRVQQIDHGEPRNASGGERRDDSEEFAGVKARPADEPPVDVRHCGQTR